LTDAFFGPYLAERQWATIREDYSEDGACWDYFPHAHARSRAYRWGEDGLLGISDVKQRLCFAIALWNGRDPILKERLFGLNGDEATHGESVKELYWYLDATPDASYLRARYRYPLRPFPYDALIAARHRHGAPPGVRAGREVTLGDTGVFADDEFVDVTVEYAKASARDVRIRVNVENRAARAARLTVIPQLWFRNTWSWPAGKVPRPGLRPLDPPGSGVSAVHPDDDLREFHLRADERHAPRAIVFTENESNVGRLWPGSGAPPSYAKDAIHDYVIDGNAGAVNPARQGTKCAFVHDLEIEARSARSIELRLHDPRASAAAIPRDAPDVFESRRDESRRFYESLAPPRATAEERVIVARACATLFWSRKAYEFDLSLWLDGDDGQPRPPEARRRGRNHDWRHFNARDVILVADTFEYPWFAAWDLAFEAVAIARADPDFAVAQLELLLGPRFLRDDGALPAYEFAFMDANPPIHAWACLRVAAIRAELGLDSGGFLARVFEPLRRNFEWWKRTVRRADGLYGGGFLGLDNVGAFDRGAPPRLHGPLAQADGTGWMAFFAASMARIADALARDEGAAGRFGRARDAFAREHALVVRALDLLWHEEDGFYFDQIRPLPGAASALPEPIRTRTIAGLVPLFALARLSTGDLLPFPEARLRRILARALDDEEFLSPFGLRSASKAHARDPVVVTDLDGGRHTFHYAPAESETLHFGANSNWRGPVWVPVNALMIDALDTWAGAVGDASLAGRARDLGRRVVSLFTAERPADDPLHFNEYFCAETGRGLGARHQGWSALAAELLRAPPGP
jgi:hypothetical protein